MTNEYFELRNNVIVIKKNVPHGGALLKRLPSNMKGILFIILCCFSLLIVNNIAVANTDDQLLTNGLYADLLFGYGHVITTPSSNGVSGTLSLGYKFSENWSIETGYVGFSRPNHSTYYLYGLIRRRIFFKNDWELFSKLGPAWVQASREPNQSNSRRITLYTGVGTTYWCRQNLGLTLQGGLTLSRDEVPTTFALNTGISYFF